MIESAQELHANNERASFTAQSAALRAADFVVASGIFSVKMDVATQEWQNYVRATIERLHALSRKGFAFNLLTSYSDPERIAPISITRSPPTISIYAKAIRVGLRCCTITDSTSLRLSCGNRDPRRGQLSDENSPHVLGVALRFLERVAIDRRFPIDGGAVARAKLRIADVTKRDARIGGRITGRREFHNPG